MTRIIAGEFGGRRLRLPDDSRVRPTADRVREAWMSILAPRLPGARVLDLFAGSGALGLEALSRGAARVTLVELSSSGVAAIRANAAELGVTDRVTVHRGDAMRFIRRIRDGEFDIALADPPYSIPYAERLIAAFRERPFAKLFAVEHPSSLGLAGDETRHYGETALTFCHAP
ncbi:MAG TPA: 16S rRNA (guanine(966)-N(2))-methyltransferase RsmD [Gemmatimonadales bacterium]|nr:16S rRNA (guanine(966)-N(2))-methyltransferase RsmD [Gemmatimonadales bacterium]